MADRHIHFPDQLFAIDRIRFTCGTLVDFLQRMANRWMVGALRYGTPHRRKQYMTRIKRELQAYERDGNMEQLVNIAVYCALEAYAPENPRFHFDPAAESVTRREMGGDIA